MICCYVLYHCEQQETTVKFREYYFSCHTSSGISSTGSTEQSHSLIVCGKCCQGSSRRFITSQCRLIPWRSFQSLVARKVVLAINNGAPSSSVIKSQRLSCLLLSWFAVLIYLIFIMFVTQRQRFKITGGT
jgi:hypothetical protein